jgi:hypothetical protein
MTAPQMRGTQAWRLWRAWWRASPQPYSSDKASNDKCSQFIYVNKDKCGDYIDCPIEMELLSIAVIVVSAP